MHSRKDITIEDFDALVTGHFTHYAIWYEEAFSAAIKKFFSTGNKSADELFSDFFMNAQHVGFEKKSQIIRKIFEIKNPSAKERFNQLCKRIEKFRSDRNILAHGLLDEDESSASPMKICVFLGSNDKTLEITPSSFATILEDCSTTLDELNLVLATLQAP